MHVQQMRKKPNASVLLLLVHCNQGQLITNEKGTYLEGKAPAGVFGCAACHC